MNADLQIWQIWANFLQRWGIECWVAALLEAAGPITILGAQMVYISQPLLNHTVPEDHLDALVRLLEDTKQARDFAEFLREGASL